MTMGPSGQVLRRTTQNCKLGVGTLTQSPQSGTVSPVGRIHAWVQEWYQTQWLPFPATLGSVVGGSDSGSHRTHNWLPWDLGSFCPGACRKGDRSEVIHQGKVRRIEKRPK